MNARGLSNHRGRRSTSRLTCARTIASGSVQTVTRLLSRINHNVIRSWRSQCKQMQLGPWWTRVPSSKATKTSFHVKCQVFRCIWIRTSMEAIWLTWMTQIQVCTSSSRRSKKSAAEESQSCKTARAAYLWRVSMTLTWNKLKVRCSVTRISRCLPSIRASISATWSRLRKIQRARTKVNSSRAGWRSRERKT